jgi:hypothetical protein
MVTPTLKVIGSSDKTVRFQVFDGSENTGELQMQRESFTKFLERMFGESYTISNEEIHVI